jgi:N-acyl-D-aspartate/D-glutamate deacylase
MASEFNLEIAILHATTALPLLLELHHVRSHQDKKQPKTQLLSWEAQLNIVCNRLAGNQLETCALDPVITPNPFCNAYVTAGLESITGQIHNSLLDAASQPIIAAYLSKRYDWDSATLASIDWEAHQTAIRSLSIPKHRFIIKLIHKILPIEFRLRQ